MRKNKKKFLIFLLLLFKVLFFVPNSFAVESITFLSLKKDEVNLRQGPSFEYPIKLIYKKKYLPVVVIDKSDAWRQTKDFENNYGWIHISQLTKRKSAINKKNKNIVYKKATIYSKPLVMLELGRLVLVEKCKAKWCKVKTGNYIGWVVKDSLWGRI